MAEAARSLGGNVTLVHGPIQSALTERFHSESFVSADDLFELMKKHADADVIIMAAAVADFKPATSHSNKVKTDRGNFQIELKQNPDTLKWLGENRKTGQVLIGFAMETEHLKENALAKLSKKNIDWVCANNLTEAGAGFGTDTNTICLLSKDTEKTFSGTKEAVSREILNFIFPG